LTVPDLTTGPGKPVGSDKVPWASWPALFFPQVQMVPSARSTTLQPPGDLVRAVTPDRFEDVPSGLSTWTCAGGLRVPPTEPLPSWPRLLSPHAQTVPSGARARPW